MSPGPDDRPTAGIGDRIGKYEILEELGQGGMGVVFRARDTELGREVALKSPWPRYAEAAEHRARFLREARIGSRLSHASIVPFFEVIEHDDVPWMSMQLVHGHSLRSVLDEEGRLGIERLLRYAVQLTGALQHAHERDILHRDINPRNVLVETAQDRAMLTDFGLARFLAPPSVTSDAATRTESLTQMGKVMGTPRYMSPEQRMGKPLQATSDIFSLGAMLYEMATGVQAFPASDPAELLEMLLSREPVPIARLAPEVPDELVRIIRKCLAKKPEERYPGARDLLVDLRALERQVVTGSQTGVTGGDIPPAPGWRLKFLVATAVVVVVAAVVVWLGGRNRDPEFGNPRQVTRAQAWEGNPALSPDGGRIAFASDETGNLDIYVTDVRGGTPLRLTQDPAADLDPSWHPDGHSIFFGSDRGGGPGIWRVGQYGGDSPLLVIPGGIQPSVSPDAERIAFSMTTDSGYLRIAVASLIDPSRIVILTGDDDGQWDHRNPSWSADGSRICYGATDNLWTVSADGGDARPLTQDGNYHEHPAWAPNDRWIFFSSVREATTALWWMPVDGDTPRRLTLGTGPERHPSFSGDGRWLAYSTTTVDMEVALYEASSGSLTVASDLHGAWMPSLHPEGSSVIAVADWGSAHGNLWIQDLAKGHPVGLPRRLTDDPLGTVSHPVFSPDGQWIAFYRILDEGRDLWCMAARGGRPNRLTTDPANDINPAWAPDGSAIAFASNRDGRSGIWVLDMQAGSSVGEPRRMTEGSGNDFQPTWSPNGTHIGFVRSEESRGDIWIVPFSDTRTPVRVTTGARALRARWSADPDHMLVTGFWGTSRVSLKSVDMRDGSIADPGRPLSPGRSSGHFDVSADRNLVVFSKEILEGDIWVLESQSHR